jgi:hypothetical protein
MTLGKLGAVSQLTSANAGNYPTPDFQSYAAVGWSGSQLVVQVTCPVAQIGLASTKVYGAGCQQLLGLTERSELG